MAKLCVWIHLLHRQVIQSMNFKNVLPLTWRVLTNCNVQYCVFSPFQDLTCCKIWTALLESFAQGLSLWTWLKCKLSFRTSLWGGEKGGGGGGGWDMRESRSKEAVYFRFKTFWHSSSLICMSTVNIISHSCYNTPLAETVSWSLWQQTLWEAEGNPRFVLELPTIHFPLKRHFYFLIFPVASLKDLES